MLKKTYLVIFILVALSSNSFSEETGRYQLFQGSYQFVNIKGEEYWSKALFKIDTVTGDVWIGRQYQYHDSNTKKQVQVRGWYPFSEELGKNIKGTETQN